MSYIERFTFLNIYLEWTFEPTPYWNNPIWIPDNWLSLVATPDWIQWMPFQSHRWLTLWHLVFRTQANLDHIHIGPIRHCNTSITSHNTVYHSHVQYMQQNITKCFSFILSIILDTEPNVIHEKMLFFCQFQLIMLLSSVQIRI